MDTHLTGSWFRIHIRIAEPEEIHATNRENSSQKILGKMTKILSVLCVYKVGYKTGLIGPKFDDKNLLFTGTFTQKHSVKLCILVALLFSLYKLCTGIERIFNN
jgi:hypothetical protein